MILTPLQELYLHTLETAPAVPSARRVRIYRALADIIGDEAMAVKLLLLAADIDELQKQLALDLKLIDDRHQQLVLEFKRRAEG